MNPIHIPISFGELIDKITILEIKSERIDDPEKLINVRNELDQLNKFTPSFDESPKDLQDLQDLQAKLKAVNILLWDIEDRIRIKESLGEFDKEFVELARSVYLRNDKRAEHKREINTRYGSSLVEEKSYASYAPARNTER